MDVHLWERLQQTAVASGLGTSEILRRCLDQGLSVFENEKALAPTKAIQGSLSH
jgi:hypothetical protein